MEEVNTIAFDSIEQLAGDLLPDATIDQKVATGFCRNHMINGEGGRIGARGAEIDIDVIEILQIGERADADPIRAAHLVDEI